jgi:hypothetical protein
MFSLQAARSLAKKLPFDFHTRNSSLKNVLRFCPTVSPTEIDVREDAPETVVQSGE